MARPAPSNQVTDDRIRCRADAGRDFDTTTSVKPAVNADVAAAMRGQRAVDAGEAGGATWRVSSTSSTRDIEDAARIPPPAT
jgi:hypothetical protein